VLARTVRHHQPTKFLHGVVSYYCKDYASAYRHLTSYLKRAPKDIGALKLLGSQALSNGDLNYALHLLEKLASRVPNDRLGPFGGSRCFTGALCSIPSDGLGLSIPVS